MSDRHSQNPTGQFLRAVLAYLLAGKLRIPRGHLPPADHDIAPDFAGIGVTTSADPHVDDYVITRLYELGIQQVRLDFTYDDADGHAGRFLEALYAQSFRVMLHLVQPFEAAKRMDTSAAKEEWRDFISNTLERFGARAEIIEIGSTVNRKRWAGYTLKGFLAAWEIAHREVRSRQMRLAGPSVTDFEPPFNIGLLAILQSRAQLPDIHTDNLFSERCTEPERYDHKIFGRRIASLIKVNLIKKARMLQKIGSDHGVAELHSPAAFWTLPRIGRLLPDVEEKQADYLARYMVLCAASGALGRAFWGPLICHREGLIDDGNLPYPVLERITHYAAVTGAVGDFRIRPSFHALKAFAGLIPGCRYEGRLNTSPILEVHAFRSDRKLFHAVWTINGRTAALIDLYANEDLQAASFVSRDGDLLSEAPTLVSETLIYLYWPPEREVRTKARATLLKAVAIHRHVLGKTHFLFRQDGWQGLVLARDTNEAEALLREIHPQRISSPPRDAILRHARNAIWTITDPRNPDCRLVVKQPARIFLHKRILDCRKPSKALRSWNGACELLRLGVETARPVAYFEFLGDASRRKNFYICEYVQSRLSVRELFSAYARGLDVFQEVPASEVYGPLSRYLLKMHSGGVFFRDLSGGNILVSQNAEGQHCFSLIDTGRTRIYPLGVPLWQRLSDLSRICNKLHWTGREQFLGEYFRGIGKTFSFPYQIPFHLYDFKVWLKRRVGRKALKRLLKKFKSG